MPRSATTDLEEQQELQRLKDRGNHMFSAKLVSPLYVLGP